MSGSPQRSPAAQKTRSTSEPPSQIEVWTGYTHYLLAADGLLRLTDAVCRKKLDEVAYIRVSAVIAAAHAALKGMNEQLIKGIDAMKEGKTPDFTFEPSPIPDWPEDAGETSVFAASWEAIKGVLERMLDAAQPSSVMQVAITGVISSGDEIVRSLEPAFG